MKNAFSVVILSGGKSTRMGKDKAMLAWQDTTLLEHILAGFSQAGEVILSVRNDVQHSEIPVKRVADEYREQGPLGGLVASMKAAEHDIVFVTTCDAPLADMKTAQLLVSSLGDYDAVVPRGSDGDHPLMAVYRKSCFEVGEDHLAQGRRKVMDFLAELNVLYVPAEKLPYGAETLSNLNTPEDLLQFKKRHSCLGKKPHILITGDLGVGKSTLVDRLLRDCTAPLYGYRTKNMLCENKRSGNVYIYPIGAETFVNTETNCVASANEDKKKGMTVHLDIFDTLGVQYLQEAKPGGLIVMDEIGFLETEAFAFRSAVLERLDGDIPVLAVVRMNKDTEFLDQVRYHEKCRLYTVTEENRDQLYEELKQEIEIIRGNER